MRDVGCERHNGCGDSEEALEAAMLAEQTPQPLSPSQLHDRAVKVNDAKGLIAGESAKAIQAYQRGRQSRVGSARDLTDKGERRPSWPPAYIA